MVTVRELRKMLEDYPNDLPVYLTCNQYFKGKLLTKRDLCKNFLQSVKSEGKKFWIPFFGRKNPEAKPALFINC